MSNPKLKPLARAMALAVPALCLLGGQAHAADVTLAPVTVTGTPIANGATTVDKAALSAKVAATSDTASLLSDVPGLSLNGAGGVSSLPSIHGLADDRLRIKVDGMDLIASCPNHMNPALSYIDPSKVGVLKVYAGIAPVSAGGDSIGGTIIAESHAPEFAAPGQATITKGEVGGFYRSNNKATGMNLSAAYATEKFNINYSGASSQADNYAAGADFKSTTATGRPGHTLPLNEVGSSGYETRNHSIGLAFTADKHVFEAKVGLQDMPNQLYPNQRMDLLGNDQQSINLRYTGQFDWGSLQARAYHEKVDHTMDFGPDKMFDYGTMGSPSLGMPMNTAGKTTGASAKADLALTPHDLLRMGGEVQRYQLDDWWPPVADSMMMGPNAFLNINNGRRDRTALFSEWEKHFAPQWLTTLGVRFERMNTNADQVHGYEQATFPTTPTMDMMNQGKDASNFNNADRNKTDNNIDLTALAKYTANSNYDIDFGFAHKTRSPNLYERYTWSTAAMMAIMNNVVGDGNGYVGDVNLKPEKANTLSATFDWHVYDNSWGFKTTPFYTQVTDYIDAVRQPSSVGSMMAPSDNNATRTTGFVRLQYANQSARLYGFDLSGHMPLTANALGTFWLKGLLNYTKGTNQDTGDDLYNVMPLNAKLAITQQLDGWDNSLEFAVVRDKSKLSDVHNEVKTPGYSLVNLRSSYTVKQVRVDFGVENLFNKFYDLPTGGAYTGQGATMGINSIPYGIAVPGMGRSIYFGVNVKF